MRYSDVKLSPMRDHRFKLIASLRFRGVVVPKGYRTDGASVPRLFWWLFPPNRTDYLPCAIIHDYLCDMGRFKEADEMFRACLEELRVDWFSRTVMYLAVRIYHLIRYGQ